MKAVDKFEYAAVTSSRLRDLVDPPGDHPRNCRRAERSASRSMIETINKLIRTSRALVQELGREPTSKRSPADGHPGAKVRKVLKIAQEPISLETPIGEEEDSHLGDFIEDRNIVSPAEAVINLNLKEQTEAVLKTRHRAKKVIKMRFGVGDGSEHTLEEVGRTSRLHANAFDR